MIRYRTSENNVRYRDTILNSISKIKYSISMHYDIEKKSISNLFISMLTHHDIEETSISKCKTSILVYTDIEHFLDIDQSSFDIHVRCRSFCASISNVLFFDIGVSLFLCLVCCARLGTHIAEYTIGLPVWPTPGPPHATTPSSSLEMTDRSAPSTGRSRRSGARPPERLPQPPERASTECRSA